MVIRKLLPRITEASLNEPIAKQTFSQLQSEFGRVCGIRYSVCGR
jgi:hypothetical protein